MRFGILGTAKIARTALIPAIAASDHRVTAIASRDLDRARSVADDAGVERAHGSYEDLIADDAVDAVYNPLPNALHAEWTRRAADAGKHVLVEKPFAVDREEAARTLSYCADRDVTVMEAFMYRFHPRTERAVEIASEELAAVHTFAGEFHFSMGDRGEDIRLDPSLAGGSTMDVGVYPIHAARTFLGEPDRVSATTVDRRDAGVDTEMAALLAYDDGSVARVASGFDTPLTQRYRVGADDGWLEVRSAFDAPDDEPLTIEWSRDGERRTETVEPVDQYRLEVEHFARAVAAGTTPRIDAADTLGTMAVVDAIAESAANGATEEVSK